MTSDLTKEFIKNEKEQMALNFHKGFYVISALPRVLNLLVEQTVKIAQKTKDYEGNRILTKFKNAVQGVSFISDSYRARYLPKDKKYSDEWVEMCENLVSLLAITLSSLPLERYHEFSVLMIDFLQGNTTSVPEYIMDSLLDYEEKETIEGLGLVQRYAPNLTVEEKESFAKDLVRWRDYSNMIQK